MRLHIQALRDQRSQSQEAERKGGRREGKKAGAKVVL